MRRWWGFWIRVFFWTKLRVIVNGGQRLWKREPWADRSDLLRFDTPQELETYVRARFKWRADATRVLGLLIPIDYVTNPRVVQSRLDQEGGGDGDCDDHHFWTASVLQLIPGVSWAHPLSCVWKGGGHTTCLYEYKGLIYLFNYRIGLMIEAPSVKLAAQLAAQEVLKWHNDNLDEGEPKAEALKFWCLETTKHKLIATG